MVHQSRVAPWPDDAPPDSTGMVVRSIALGVPHDGLQTCLAPMLGTQVRWSPVLQWEAKPRLSAVPEPDPSTAPEPDSPAAPEPDPSTPPEPDSPARGRRYELRAQMKPPLRFE